MLNEFTYDEHAETILSRIESRLASGLSRARLANESETRLDALEDVLKRQTRFIAGRNQDTPRETLSSLERWLVEEDEQGTQKPSSHAPTPTYQRISTLLGIAHTKRKLIAITGDVGIGKSAAACAYAAAKPKTDHAPGTVYVEFAEVDAKPTAALNRIFEALPGKGISGHRQENLLDAIAGLLKPGDMLILDECNYLSGRNGRDGRALDVIRDLYGKSRASIAMLGNPDLRARVWGKSEDFAALASRTLHYPMGHTTEEDVDAWLQWAGLTGKALRTAAIKIAVRPGQNGGLRTLDKVIELTRDFYPDAFTADSIEHTARMIGRL